MAFLSQPFGANVFFLCLCLQPLRCSFFNPCPSYPSLPSHRGMTAILKKHIFVGVVDDVFSLIQHDTKLLLVRHVELCKELFYQLAVRRFACMPRSVPLPSLRSALCLPVGPALLSSLASFFTTSCPVFPSSFTPLAQPFSGQQSCAPPLRSSCRPRPARDGVEGGLRLQGRGTPRSLPALLLYAPILLI